MADLEQAEEDILTEEEQYEHDMSDMPEYEPLKTSAEKLTAYFAENPPDPEKTHVIVPDFNPVETLLLKLEAWLIQQPEWSVLLAAPRQTRRKAITLLSKRILTIPSRGRPFGGM